MMKEGDKGKLKPKRKLLAQAGSDMMAAAEIEKRSLFGVESSTKAASPYIAEI